MNSYFIRFASRAGVALILAWMTGMLIAFHAGADERVRVQTVKAADPKGWRGFHWGMTERQAKKSGAHPFVDAEGERRLGLSRVELLPGKTFQVDLRFFSSMGLNAVRVSLAPHGECARGVYEILLKDFREKYGREMESRDLDYPNSTYRSHDWIAGSTKIVLHHGCPKPGRPANSPPTTHIWYEKRFEVEPWNQ